MSDLLIERYKLENIDPETRAFALIDGKIYTTVAGMELKAMRSGVLAGKTAVEFGPEIDAVNKYDQTDINVPTWAVATYKRLIMDKPSKFSSDPVHFFEYAKQRWHYEKPFMFLAKIARACALRHAFPDILAGVISAEEIQCELNFGDEKNTDYMSGGSIKTVEPAHYKRAVITEIPVSPTSVSEMVASIFKK
jgi:hypothetical protein